MPEPTTLAAVGVGGFVAEKLGGKELLVKLLGPTADYIGTGLRHSTERGVSNIVEIFKKSCAKLGPRLDEPGAVPPRTLLKILQEGFVCDTDSLASDYFAGVLASSRTRGQPR